MASLDDGSPLRPRVAASSRLLVWQAASGQGMELARVQISDDSLVATGTAIGTEPEPYLLSYSLETGPEYVTRRLQASADGPAWSRHLELVRAADGTWSADGRSLDEVADALDCDLGRSPLTNTMPVLRHRLHRSGGPVDFVMAWVAVPELTVHRSEQQYRYLGPTAENVLVRYVGRHRDFVGDLEVDTSGIVVRYPDLAALVADRPV